MAVVVGQWSVEPAGAAGQSETAPQQPATADKPKHDVGRALRQMKARSSRVRAH
jgi:hypothetical protein